MVLSLSQSLVACCLTSFFIAPSYCMNIPYAMRAIILQRQSESGPPLRDNYRYTDFSLDQLAIIAQWEANMSQHLKEKRNSIEEERKQLHNLPDPDVEQLEELEHLGSELDTLHKHAHATAKQLYTDLAHQEECVGNEKQADQYTIAAGKTITRRKIKQLEKNGNTSRAASLCFDAAKKFKSNTFHNKGHY